MRSLKRLCTASGSGGGATRLRFAGGWTSDVSAKGATLFERVPFADPLSDAEGSTPTELAAHGAPTAAERAPAALKQDVREAVSAHCSWYVAVQKPHQIAFPKVSIFMLT